MSARTNLPKQSAGNSINSSTSSAPSSSDGNGVRHYKGKRSAARSSSSGNLPVASESTSISRILTLVAMRLVRRLFLARAELKALVYLVAVVVVSLVVDTLPPAISPPTTYFAYKHNILNVVFVKWGWAWTLVITGALSTLTAMLTGGGEWLRVRSHWIRLGAATLTWYLVIALLNRVERSVGVCRLQRVGRHAGQSPRISRDDCLATGGIWRGFDISGHSFLLVFCGLLIVEEAGAIDGWHRIADWIRSESHVRSQPSTSPSPVTPLHHLSADEFDYVRVRYLLYNRLVCAVFVALVVLAALWDTMLMATAVYFHTPLQKTIGGVVGVCSWWFLYRSRVCSSLLVRPGCGGLFSCSSPQTQTAVSSTSFSSARFSQRGSVLASSRTTDIDEGCRARDQPLSALKSRTVGGSK